MKRTGFRHRLKHIAAGITSAVTAAGMMLYLPASVFAAEDVTGTTSDGYDYLITAAGVAKITGYSGEDKATITALSVPESVKGVTVTVIDGTAFQGMKTVTSLTIPDTVETIERHAFDSLGISELHLPENLKLFEVGVIAGCENLRELTVPKGVPADVFRRYSYIGGWDATFKDSYIEKIIFEDGIETIPHQVCAGNDHITEIVIPESVTKIGYNAFDDGDTVTEFDLPDGLLEIEANAFEDTGMSELRLPDSLTAIGRDAFKNCQNLTALTLPAGITDADYALRDSYIEELTFADGMKAAPEYVAANAGHLQKVNIPRSMTALNWHAFTGSGIKEFTLPKQIESANAPFRDSALETIHFEDGRTRIPDECLKYARNLTEIDWADSVTEIGSYAFGYCTALETVVIPDTVTVIGGNAFYSCEGITSLTIPDNLPLISTSAFYGTKSLKYVYLPLIQFPEGNGYSENLFSSSGLETIEFAPEYPVIPASVCSYCRSLKEIKWPAAPTEIRSSAFYDCEALETVQIPDTVTLIGSNAFNTCTSLSDLHLPASLEQLGEKAFRDTIALKYVYLPRELTGHGSLSFYNSGIEHIDIADGITKIGRTFEGLPELRSVSLPDSLTEIGASAFEGAVTLGSVTLPPTLESIGNAAFCGCSSLRRVTIPKTVRSIGRSAFASGFEKPSGLEEIWFEDGMQTIPEHACYGAENLQIAHIPSSVTEIGNSAFCGCRSLETVDAPQADIKHYQDSFTDCDSLFDKRFSIFMKDTFINNMVSSVGENGLVNYAIYYSINPRFREKLEGIELQVNTAYKADIVLESLPPELKANLSGFSYYPENPEGVIRFSIRTSSSSDASVNAKILIKQSDEVYRYSKNIICPGIPTPSLSLNAPQSVLTSEGKAMFRVSGYAPLGGTVQIKVTNSNAAEETVFETSAEASPYIGKYSAEIEIAGADDDVLKVEAACGDFRQEATVICDMNQNAVEQVLLTHYGDTLDITEAFTVGTLPYYRWNANDDFRFEVRLKHNDCAAVMITSTVNGDVSAIRLTFDEASGTWKGSGRFATAIPGTLNVVAYPQQYHETLRSYKNDDGTTRIETEGHTFLSGSETDAEEINDFIKNTNAEIVTSDENGIISKFSFTAPNGDQGTAVEYLGKHSSLQIGGNAVTPEDVMKDPEKYGFERSPMEVTDEDGNVHRYLVKIITDSAEAENTFYSIPVIAATQPAKQLPGAVNPQAAKTLGQWFFDLLADGGEYADTAAKCVNGTIVTEVTCKIGVGLETNWQGEPEDFIVNVTTETEKGLAAEAFKAAGKEGVANGIGNTMSYLEVATDGLKMMKRLRDISFSTDPEVQKNEQRLYNETIGHTMARATLVLAGGAAAGKAFAAVGAAAIAGGSVLVPLLAAVAVVGTVWYIGSLLTSWGKSIDDRIKGKGQVGQSGKLRPIIDPSGIAYEYRKNNPIEGVTANIYYQDDDGNAVLWNAADYDQENPQTTNHNGWYAWDVPQGLWQVRLTKKGYTDAQSEWLPVLPVQVGVDLNMTSKNPAAILTADYYGGKAVVRFDRHVMTETVTTESLYLTDASGTMIPCSISVLQEEGNDAEASIAFTLNTRKQASLEGASVNLTADVKSYAGIASKAMKVKLVQASEDFSPEPDILTGDVNDDGEVSVDDAQLALKAYTKRIAGLDMGLTERQIKAANVNGDDELSVDDAQNILKYYTQKTVAGKDITWEDILG